MMIPLAIYTHVAGHPAHNTQIAVAQDFGDKVRLTVFDRRGSVYHNDYSDPARLQKELGWEGWQENPAAAEELEAWTKTPEWEQGLKSVQFVAVTNTLRFYGHYDMAHLVELHPNIDNAIALGAKFCRELGYSIF